jgi:hypothetical protein
VSAGLPEASTLEQPGNLLEVLPNCMKIPVVAGFLHGDLDGSIF